MSEALTAGAGVAGGRRPRRDLLRGPLVDGSQGRCPPKQPAPWFFGGLLLRMTIALAGFYFTSGGHWERLLVCFLGFVLARPIVARVTPHGSQRDGTGGQSCASVLIN